MTREKRRNGLPPSVALKLSLVAVAAGLVSAGAARADSAPLAQFTVITEGATPARTVSFGQIFQTGRVHPGDHLTSRVGDKTAELQMDAKALNHDGSVRHAVITIALPDIGARAHLSGAIMADEGGDSAGQAAPQGFSVPPLQVAFSLVAADGSATARNIDLRTIARDPASQIGQAWIKGPLAEERRFAAEVNNNIEVVFDVFVPRSGPSRVDVSVHNDWITAHKADTVRYDVDMRIAGKSVYSAQAVNQYPFSTWHHVVWSDGREPPQILQDVSELISAAAIPSYDTSADVDSDLLRELERSLAGSGRPFDVTVVEKHMPDTGGRWDIGPLPTWSVAYLLSKRSVAGAVMFEAADEAGFIPWHVRERKTRSPLTLDKYPDLWLDGRGDPVPGALPESFELETHGWTIDDAHEPSLVYLPYLLTGSQYYRDELSQQAAFVLLSFDPGYRGGAHGYFVGENGEAWEQERALAWSLRTIANAAFVLPSNDPLQHYFDTKLKSNLAQLVKLYVTGRTLRSAGEVEGWIPGADVATDGVIYPWQQSFIAMILGWINDMGYPDAGRTLTWMSGFTCGIFTNADKGFDPSRGIAYTVNVYDTEKERNYATWREVFGHSEVRDTEPDELEEWRHDYGTITYAGLGAALKIARTTQCQKAYRYVGARIAGDERDPTFQIVPDLSGDRAAP
ncbi:MAG: hypothetical protein WAW96_07340 [Alphaproteobacteria bacterium]